MDNNNIHHSVSSLDTSFKNGRYDEFLKTLIENKDKFDQKIFHYDLGTVFLQKGNYPVARFHLEKALILGQKGKEIEGNLKSALQKLQLENQLLMAGKTYWDSLNNVLLQIPPSSFLTMSLLVGIFAIRSWNKLKLRKAPLLLLLFLGAFAPLVLSQTYLKDLRYAITINQSSIRDGPSEIFEMGQTVPAGSKIIIKINKEKGSGWCLVKFPQSYSGWIKKIDLGIL